MWAFTKLGFYSVVAKKARGKTLVVRARARGDLEALRPYLPKKPEMEIIVLPVADYRFRIEVEQSVWSKLMAKLVNEIDYHNFKDTVAAHQGSERSRLYHDVWSVMMGLQREEVAKEAGASVRQTPSRSSLTLPFDAAGTEDALPDEWLDDTYCTECGWTGNSRDLRPSAEDPFIMECPECQGVDGLKPASREEDPEDDYPF